jgi:hypothetical protein
MQWSISLSRLRDVLAMLYPTLQDTPLVSQTFGREQASHSASSPSDTDTVTEQRATLQQLLAQHRRNLLRLQSKKAVYAAGEEPLSLLNQIEHEEQEIGRIQAELQSS